MVIPGAAPIVLLADEDMLHRALFNLLLNAVQASPPDSIVTIEVSPDVHDGITGERQFANGGVAIRVIDTGPGVPKEILSRLFDPFTTTKPQGSGLGLAVVQRAVEAHKGLVLLESDETGTRVMVLLPRVAPPVPAFA